MCKQRFVDEIALYDKQVFTRTTYQLLSIMMILI